MQKITVTPLEAMGQLIMAANLIDTAECKDEGIYNRLQGAISVAETVLAQEVAALAMALKQEARKPTDISQRLREYAVNNGYSHNDYADTMRAAADEIERYYGGMMNWKKTAEAKDAAPAAANGAPEGYVMVPLKPTPEMIKAMAESRATDDEGDFPLMIDLLDFSGENKARAALEAAYMAAVGLWPILAAAGPDAALVNAASNVVTCFNDPHTSLAYVARWVNELSEEIAALSGAKGN